MTRCRPPSTDARLRRPGAALAVRSCQSVHTGGKVVAREVLGSLILKHTANCFSRAAPARSADSSQGAAIRFRHQMPRPGAPDSDVSTWTPLIIQAPITFQECNLYGRSAIFEFRFGNMPGQHAKPIRLSVKQGRWVRLVGRAGDGARRRRNPATLRLPSVIILAVTMSRTAPMRYPWFLAILAGLAPLSPAVAQDDQQQEQWRASLQTDRDL